MPSWKKILISGSDAAVNTLFASNGITGSHFGTSSWAVNSQTASYVTTLNQNVLVTGSVTIGASTAGASENTLTLGARDGANEGGQLGLNAPGGTYTSASFIDVWQNYIRILRGTNAGSDGLVTQWNLQTKQMQLPAYTAASSFVGTAAANLAVDSSGNVITVSTSGGSVFPYTGNAVITGSLTTTGAVIAQANGAMYFRGGDDAELWDINVTNTVGLYGQQDQTVGSLKLGSGGGILSGKSGNIGVNTVNPTSASLTVNGNVWATSFTGSLFGTSSYAIQALSASWAPVQASASYASTASYVVNALTASFITTAQTASFVTGSNVYGPYGSNSITSASFAVSSSRAVSSSFTVSASYSNTSTSASYALTASYVNPLNQTLTLTGSFNQNGDYNHTGSVYHSGSKYLNGIFSQTGSLNITGSTTQIGTNNLYGNTTLSGSIIISGSTTTPATPTIKVYGDMETNGVVKFMPVVKNIDNLISGSYIYVSGSTNDLYFTQNGSGYANSTRLRWMEGNLYTGLLSGGVISSTPGSTTFNVSSGSGIIVTLNAFTSSADPFPTIQYVKWPTYTGLPIQNSGSAKITYLSINSAGTVAQQTVPIGSTDVNQWDTQIELGVVLHLSGSVSTGVYNAPQVAYGSNQRADDFIRAFGPVKVSGHTLQASGSSPTLSLIKGSGTAYNNGANYVNNPNHPSVVSDPAINTSKIYRYYISGSTPIIDTGVANAGYTAIDSKNYVDTTTGTLTAVGAAYWSIQRVFWIPNSPTNAFIVYYGNARYGNLVDATNAKDSEPFIEAPNTAQNAIFLGYIIIQGGGSGTPARDLLNANEATIIQGGLFRNVGGIGSSGTSPIASTFAGLSDVSVGSRATGDLLTYNGSQWVNTKTLTGNYSVNGNLTVTGSIIGTASYAQTASYVNGNIFTNSNSAASASYAVNATSASYALTASYVNPLVQTVVITGSLINGNAGNIAIGQYSHAEGLSTAQGIYSHAEGYGTLASAQLSHAEGYYTTTTGNNSHAEGEYTLTLGLSSHAEGRLTTSSGNFSHAEGSGSITRGTGSHAEGFYTVTSGSYSHAEGVTNIAIGEGSHAEGVNTTSVGYYSHAEGYGAYVAGNYSHGEGYLTAAGGTGAHAEGAYTSASGDFSHAEGAGFGVTGVSIAVSDIVYLEIDSSDPFITISGNPVSISTTQLVLPGDSRSYYTLPFTLNYLYIENASDSLLVNFAYPDNLPKPVISSITYNAGTGNSTFNFSTPLKSTYVDVYGKGTVTLGPYSHAEGVSTATLGTGSHAEGVYTTASGNFSHAEGGYTLALANYSHAEGVYTIASADGAHAEGSQTIASELYSHAEGGTTRALGYYSHAEGTSTRATAFAAHAEGSYTLASGGGAHAEGNSTTASANYSHAEGYYTTANSDYAHAEGYFTRASNSVAHAEGYYTLASGIAAHTEGQYTTASGNYSHAEGFTTIAAGNYQHVAGQYNISSTAQSAFIIGNGTGTGASRSNLLFASGSQVQITGSLNVTQGITGSLLGNASTATTATSATSASYASTVASGLTNYIQNQNSTGQSANMWITGIGKFGDHIDILSTSSTGYITIDGAQSGHRKYLLENGITGISNSGFQIRDVTGGFTPFYIDAAGAATFYSNITTAGYAVIGGSAYLASGNYLYFDSGVTNNYGIRKTGTTLELTSAGNFTFNNPVNVTVPSNGGDINVTSGTVVGKLGASSGSPGIYIGAQSNNDVYFQSNNTTRATLTSGGNLAVGTTSTSYKFHVAGGQYGTYLKGGDLGTGSDILRLVDASSDTKYLARGDGKHFFTGDTDIQGTLTATVKSFVIDHPTKEGKKLQYGVLEGPEHSVYVRGKLTKENIIVLPDHWHALVHEDTITVNLTSIGKKQDLWVEEVNSYEIKIGSENEINCFYTVFAERKDIEKLVTEFDIEQ